MSFYILAVYLSLVCANLVHYEEVFCHDSSEDNGHKLCKQQTTDASHRGHEWDYAYLSNIHTFFRGTGSWSQCLPAFYPPLIKRKILLARNTSIIGNRTGFSSNRIVATHKRLSAVIVYGSSRDHYAHVRREIRMEGNLYRYTKLSSRFGHPGSYS